MPDGTPAPPPSDGRLTPLALPAVDEARAVRHRLLVLREEEARIGALIAMHSARLAALSGDVVEVRSWCKLADLAERIQPRAFGTAKCVVCGQPTPATGRYQRSTCSTTCLHALRSRNGSAPRARPGA